MRRKRKIAPFYKGRSRKDEKAFHERCDAIAAKQARGETIDWDAELA